jgi:hypothetical protein
VKNSKYKFQPLFFAMFISIELCSREHYFKIVEMSFIHLITLFMHKSSFTTWVSCAIILFLSKWHNPCILSNYTSFYKSEGVYEGWIPIARPAFTNSHIYAVDTLMVVGSKLNGLNFKLGIIILKINKLKCALKSRLSNLDQTIINVQTVWMQKPWYCSEFGLLAISNRYCSEFDHLNSNIS